MKLNYKRTFLVGLAFLSICSFWNIYDSIIPLILKNTFLLGDTVSGAIMAVDNVLALFMLPLFGMLSDRCNSRMGRRMPFIIAGTCLAVAFMILIPLFDGMALFVPFFVVLGCTLVSMSIYRSPAVALMPDLTHKPLRSKANAIINLMGAFGSIYGLVMIRLLVPPGDRPNYMPLFLSVALLMFVCVAILALTIRERKLTQELQIDDEPEEQAAEGGTKKLESPVRRSLIFLLLSVAFWYMAYNAVITAFSKYAQSYLGLEGGGFADCLLIATIAAVITYIPAGFVASKIGRKKTILFGVALMLVSFGVGAFFRSFSPVLYVFFALVGIGWASINVNSYPMVVDMTSGSKVGRYTGYYYIFSMAAQIVTPILSGFFLEHVGYYTLFPYAVLFSAIAFMTMTLVKHGDSRPEPPQAGVPDAPQG